MILYLMLQQLLPNCTYIIILQAFHKLISVLNKLAHSGFKLLLIPEFNLEGDCAWKHI